MNERVNSAQIKECRVDSQEQPSSRMKKKKKDGSELIAFSLCVCGGGKRGGKHTEEREKLQIDAFWCTCVHEK